LAARQAKDSGLAFAEQRSPPSHGCPNGLLV
jgi:hypothetical protein